MNSTVKRRGVSKMRRGPIRPPRNTVNGPINISRQSKALPSMRSVVPESVRPRNRHSKRDHAAGQRDNSRAETTPRNPQQCWAETSAAPLRLLRARYYRDGRTVTLELPYFSGYRLVRTVGNHRESRTSLAQRRCRQRNLDRMRCTTLVKMPVALSGGSRENCEPAGWRDLQHLPMNYLPGYWSMRSSAASPIFTLVNWFHDIRLHPLRDIKRTRSPARPGENIVVRPDWRFRHSALALARKSSCSQDSP